ncbi:MAG: Transcriptional activator of fatty acid utilization [Caeruleum heppii]|nr:MAG: Transcriptional activator of fatty acid utilization [Caeruleum heppii]
MPPATYQSNGMRHGYADDTTYPSRNIAFQAAGMITSIIENLQHHDQLRYCPAFIVYSLFSALIMHVYQMRSSVPSLVSATQDRMQVCMNALKDVSKVWLVAKMVHTLFESILGNKVLEDKLQKAAGKRHNKAKHGAQKSTAEQPKRKYDDMELGFAANGPPAPQVSYERSRPQTPAVTPSRELGAPQAMSNTMQTSNPGTSPHLRQQQDTFMGGLNSRSNTRPPTPFNPSYSVPATPPDLYLVTRSSPPISQNLWENFQPDQLFPESSSNLSLAQFSPPSAPHQTLDPQLSQTMPQMQQTPTMQANNLPGAGSAQLPQRPLHRQPGMGSPMTSHNMLAGSGPSMQGLSATQWPTQPFENLDLAGSNSDDSWSNSSKGAAIPTTLNVEDWYVETLKFRRVVMSVIAGANVEMQ